ncbi:hypothetical protein [uncultured Maribacter sp.]|uniref:hypothetical protein n=1 Tax=uncultured Maribacter sp. TaxID=431308 RepID=UPI00260C432E|nr:hypothetical protein [uncultured Maribacter sp.]
MLSKIEIDQNEERTIGLVYDIDGGTATASPSLVYKYIVSGKEYHSTSSFSGNKKMYLNHFYEVRYSSKSPDLSEILLDSIVSDIVMIKKAGLTLPEKKKKKRNQFRKN